MSILAALFERVWRTEILRSVCLLRRLVFLLTVQPWRAWFRMHCGDNPILMTESVLATWKAIAWVLSFNCCLIFSSLLLSFELTLSYSQWLMLILSMGNLDIFLSWRSYLSLLFLKGLSFQGPLWMNISQFREGWWLTSLEYCTLLPNYPHWYFQWTMLHLAITW